MDCPCGTASRSPLDQRATRRRRLSDQRQPGAYCDNYLESFTFPTSTRDWRRSSTTRAIARRYRYGNLQPEIAKAGSRRSIYKRSSECERARGRVLFLVVPNIMLNFYPWASLNVVTPSRRTDQGGVPFVRVEFQLREVELGGLHCVEMEDDSCRIRAARMRCAL
jgi:hypothetical protein